MTSWATSLSRSSRAAITRRIWSSTSPPMASSVCLSASSSSWKCRCMGVSPALAEPAGDVVLRSLVAGVREQPPRDPELDELAQQQEAGVVGDPGGLLHVVGHDHDGVAVLELQHELLDLGGGDRIEGGARLVHQQHVGL